MSKKHESSGQRVFFVYSGGVASGSIYLYWKTGLKTRIVLTMEVTGIVAGGSARASALGYPTANIPLGGEVSGIYVVRVEAEGKRYGGVAYADASRGILESHLFDFAGDLYGKEIAVTLIEKLRDARPFENETDERQTIADDAHAARNHLSILV